MTNLSGGWLRGRDLVQEAFREAGVNRVIVLLDAAEARERAERRRMEGDYGGAGEVLREASDALGTALPGDADAAQEAAELSDLASRLEEERFVAET